MAEYFSILGDSTRIILGLLGWLSLNVVGLALVAIARLRRHWFLRAALALVVVSTFALLPGMNIAPAYDLVLLVFAQACVVLAPWFVFPTGRATHRIQRRFSLSSLLLFMPLVAIVTALAVRVPEHVWEWSPWLFLWGAAAGLSNLAAAVVGLGIGPWWSLLLVLLPAVPSLPISAWLFLGKRRPPARRGERCLAANRSLAGRWGRTRAFRSVGRSLPWRLHLASGAAQAGFPAPFEWQRPR